MSLISCKECGNQISDLAMKCPHCGAGRISSVGVSNVGALRVVGLILLFIGLGCVGLGFYYINSLTVFNYQSAADPQPLFTWGPLLMVFGGYLMFNKWKQR
ncbi:MAG: zinc ribbon domain-containing protein [Bacteroidota bacterium]